MLSVITILFPFKLVTSPMRWFPYPAIISVKSRVFLNFPFVYFNNAHTGPSPFSAGA